MDPARAKAFEAAFTPLPIALQAMRRAADFFGLLPSCHELREVCSFLDPAAGAGVWCQAAREVFKGPFVYAVEKRPEEAQWLRRNADEFAIADFLEHCLSNSAFDLCATNPPFSLFADFAEEGLRVADHCWLYAPCDIAMRKKDAAEWFAENQRWVAAEFTTPGPLAFHGSSNSDFRTYSLWCLSGGDRSKGWHRELLPMLPGHDRRWTVRPGTEVLL